MTYESELPAGSQYPYASQRMPVLAGNVVATSQPLAAQAGLRMLLAGGNAVDAILAAAMTLTVVEPCSNGIGSDAFGLIWDGSKLHGLNASGRAPKAWTPERFAGLAKMPANGWDSVTVPGCVSAWVALSKKFGKLPLEKIAEPAIGYARNGYLVSPVTAQAWSVAPAILGHMPDFRAAFMPGGRTPHPGELFRFPDQGDTLAEIAATKGESFYRGALARKIAAHARATGGLMTEEDLGGHTCDWVEPISQEFRGIRLSEIPPNGQGLAALIALGILQHLDLPRYPVDSADSVHLQIEAMKLAFRDAHSQIADPRFMTLAAADLLKDERLEKLAKAIRLDRAAPVGSPLPTDHGTVYLTAADESGMMVSYIQSNFIGFGSGIVVPGTGISLQCRGHGFRTEAGHPNQVAGGKRPYHTIIPGFVTRDGQPLVSFGVMGGHMQPQGHVQMMVRLFAYGQNPQAAADAPRWMFTEEGTVALEAGMAPVNPGVADALRGRGHQVSTNVDYPIFGGAQMIYRLQHGYAAASDKRKDGQAVGF